MKWPLHRIFARRPKADKKRSRKNHTGAAPMILSFDGRIVRLYPPGS